MTCADNINALQHEKRACRVKCTFYTQGQEATKNDGTTGTECKTKECHTLRSAEPQHVSAVLSLFPWHPSSIARHLCFVRFHVSQDTRLGSNAAYS